VTKPTDAIRADGPRALNSAEANDKWTRARSRSMVRFQTLVESPMPNEKKRREESDDFFSPNLPSASIP